VRKRQDRATIRRAPLRRHDPDQVRRVCSQPTKTVGTPGDFFHPSRWNWNQPVLE
jgi:hypothetical protein